jgi:hypothetical protein
LLASQLANIVERNRHVMLGIEQQVVFGQESGKEHPVPMLVGASLNETLDFLSLPLRVATITELAAMRAELIAQSAVFRRHVSPGLVMVHGILIGQRLAGAFLSDGTGLGDPIFEQAAMFTAQRGH